MGIGAAKKGILGKSLTKDGKNLGRIYEKS